MDYDDRRAYLEKRGQKPVKSMTCLAIGPHIAFVSIESQPPAPPSKSTAPHAAPTRVVPPPTRVLEMSDTAILFDPFTGDEEIEYVPQDEPSVSCALMAWRNQHIHPEGALGGRRTRGHVESAGSSLFNTPPKLCSPPVSASLSFISCGAQTLSDLQGDATKPSHPEGALGGRVTTGHVKFEGSSFVNTPPELCYPPIASPFPIVSSAHPLNNPQIDPSVTSIVHLEGARGGRMTNSAIKSLGGPLFNTPPEVSHSPPPSISTFAPPNGLSPPSSLPDSEGTAARGDNSGSAREALLYKRSSRSARARALLK